MFGDAFPHEAVGDIFVECMIFADCHHIPLEYIIKTIKEEKYNLDAAYLTLTEKIDGVWDVDEPPWEVKEPGSDTIERGEDLVDKQLIKDLVRYANKIPAIVRRSNRLVFLREKRKLQILRRLNKKITCGCCFHDVPPMKVIYCQGKPSHPFCSTCFHKQAQHIAGVGRHKLFCMSTAGSGCDAEFSQKHYDKILDDGLLEVIRQNESMENLAKAGSFCDTTAIYPSVDEVRDFHCQHPGCAIISCRKCGERRHGDLECASSSRTHDMVHQVDEAQSKALIRRCKTCRVPFIKSDGCNKIKCPLPSCGTVQCYICNEICDYKHFHNERTSRKIGDKCPLFDDTQKRHRRERREAKAKMKMQLGSLPENNG